MELKTSELRKLIKVNYTPSQLKKEVEKGIKHIDNPTLDIFVYTSEYDGIYSSNLMIYTFDGDGDGDYYENIEVCTIELNTNEVGDVDFWKFKELSEKTLATKKQNTIKQFSNYQIVNTEDGNV